MPLVSCSPARRSVGVGRPERHGCRASELASTAKGGRAAGKLWPVDGAEFVGIHQDAYVARLQSAGAIQSPIVEAAFRRVPRHRLIESFYTGRYTEEGLVVVDPDNPTADQLATIYGEGALVTRVTDGRPASSSSAPGLVASMLDLLESERGQSVLEIGAGTGYNAALLAEVVGDQRRVVTIDYQDDVAAQTRRLLSRAGYPGHSRRLWRWLLRLRGARPV